MKEYHVIASGNVQGVGFRATACSVAREMGVVGYVTNKSDGTVEIIAQAEEDVLQKYFGRLQSLFHAELASESREPQDRYSDFSIAP